MGCYVTPQGVPKDACIISEKYRQASTFYLFNHVDITIYYHSGKGKFVCKVTPLGLRLRFILHILFSRKCLLRREIIKQRGCSVYLA